MADINSFKLKHKSFALMLVCALMLSACASSRSLQITAPPQVFHSLSTPQGKHITVNTTMRTTGMSPDGKLLVIGNASGVYAFYTDTLDLAGFSVAEYPLWIYNIAFSSDGERFATDGGDLEEHKVVIWNTSNVEPEYSLVGFSTSIESIDFHPERNVLAVGLLRGNVIVWDMDEEEVIFSSRKTTRQYSPEDRRTKVVWSPDGLMLAVGGKFSTIQIWAPETGELVNTIECICMVDGIAWAPDAKHFAVNSDNNITIWNTQTWKQKNVLPGIPPDPHVAAGGGETGFGWSPDGSFIALGITDGRILIWDIETGELSQILDDHSGAAHSLFWTPDGDRLISSGYDNRVIVWDIERGEPLRILEFASTVFQ